MTESVSTLDARGEAEAETATTLLGPEPDSEATTRERLVRPASPQEPQRPSMLFLALPALRMFRVVSSLRTVRVLPAARVVGSSYRTIGTARTLLGSRLVFASLAATIGAFFVEQRAENSESDHEGAATTG